MKPFIPAVLGALLCNALAVAAQTTPSSATTPAPAVSYVAEPSASSANASGPDADLSNAIVQALNADGSLKNLKITVRSDDGLVILTGSASSQDQVKRATEIAVASAGEGKVINTIQPDRIVYKAGA